MCARLALGRPRRAPPLLRQTYEWNCCEAKLGRPPIGKHPMTAAARQRRHRRSGAVTKPAAKPVASPAAADLPQLLTDAQLEHWAGELDIDLDQLDQLASLIGRQMLSLFENDPKGASPMSSCA